MADEIAGLDPTRCGGCQNAGAHRRHCPRHPDYHPWKVLADRADSIGDSIGQPDLANAAWSLAGRIRERMTEVPYRPRNPPAEPEAGERRG